jgi:hypothetical protein
MKTKVIFLSCLFFGTGFADNQVLVKQDDFVIKKNTKKVSKSKLQEDTCTIFGDQISSIPDINQKVSQVQKILLEHTCKYLENSGDCVILKNDKKKMDEILKVAKNFGQKMEDFIKDCDKYLQYLSSIK